MTRRHLVVSSSHLGNDIRRPGLVAVRAEITVTHIEGVFREVEGPWIVCAESELRLRTGHVNQMTATAVDRRRIGDQHRRVAVYVVDEPFVGVTTRTCSVVRSAERAASVKIATVCVCRVQVLQLPGQNERAVVVALDAVFVGVLPGRSLRSSGAVCSG